MKSNTLLFSSLKENSKLSMHYSHLMICRKKKEETTKNNSGETTVDPEMASGSRYYKLPLKSVL